MAKKIDNATIGHGFGILSIVLAFFTPIAALIIGIIGLRKSSKEKLKESVKLNWIGIVISLVIIILSIIVTIYSYSTGLNLGNLPY